MVDPDVKREQCLNEIVSLASIIGKGGGQRQMEMRCTGAGREKK